MVVVQAPIFLSPLIFALLALALHSSIRPDWLQQVFINNSDSRFTVACAYRCWSRTNTGLRPTPHRMFYHSVFQWMESYYGSRPLVKANRQFCREKFQLFSILRSPPSWLPEKSVWQDGAWIFASRKQDRPSPLFQPVARFHQLVIFAGRKQFPWLSCLPWVLRQEVKCRILIHHNWICLQNARRFMLPFGSHPHIQWSVISKTEPSLRCIKLIRRNPQDQGTLRQPLPNQAVAGLLQIGCIPYWRN